MQPFTTLSGQAIPFGAANIDTDVIIPARFLKTISRAGLGKGAFAALRENPDNVFDAHAGAPILIAGHNFGCGSSREHAPQALYRFGIRAIIAESFAEIFFGNSITLGMPCVVMTGEDIRSVTKLIESDPAALLTLDLTEKKLSIADMDFPITIAPHAHEALVSGKWDAIADLLEGIDAVRTRVATLPYIAA